MEPILKWITIADRPSFWAAEFYSLFASRTTGTAVAPSEITSLKHGATSFSNSICLVEDGVLGQQRYSDASHPLAIPSSGIQRIQVMHLATKATMYSGSYYWAKPEHNHLVVQGLLQGNGNLHGRGHYLRQHSLAHSLNHRIAARPNPAGSSYNVSDSQITPLPVLGNR